MQKKNVAFTQKIFFQNIFLIWTLTGFFFLSGIEIQAQSKPNSSFQEVIIPLRDGNGLATDLYLPSASGKYPTILIITPYNRLLLRRITAIEKPFILIDREKYAYVFVDWRGFFGSKAAASGKGILAARLAGQDGYDVIEWIAQQEWSNGKIGMWGASALGKVQFMTAVEQPPHLVCICPMVMGFDNSYEKYYHGGVFKRGRTENQEKAGWQGTVKLASAQPNKTLLWQILEKNSWKNLQKIQVPVFLIGGWYDLETEGVLNTFQKFRTKGSVVAQKETRILIGPWDHMGASAGKKQIGDLDFPEAEEVSAREARRFFDYWLLEQKNNGWEKKPPIQWFQMGENQWKNTSEASPGPPQELYLAPANKLISSPPTEEKQYSFVFDPKNPSPTIGGMNLALPRRLSTQKLEAGPKDQREEVESRSDLIAFSTEVLTENFSFQGNVQVCLFVSSDQPDTDMVVRLCDVYPDGRSILITDGAHRMRFRNSLSKAEMMVPNQTYNVTVTLSVSAHTFQKGHQIRILVSSSNYPRFDVNPNNGENFLNDKPPLKATNTLFCGPHTPAKILFPRLKQ